jgi:putative transcriptional regulator
MKRAPTSLTENDLKKLGETIRRARERQKMSQTVLAEKCGFQKSYVSGVETGTRNIRFLSLLVIARALGASVSELADQGDAVGATARSRDLAALPAAFSVLRLPDTAAPDPQTARVSPAILNPREI